MIAGKLLLPVPLFTYLLTYLLTHASDNEINIQDKRSILRGIDTVSHKHICSIFDRGTRRFTLEMPLWNDYINFLKEKKSNILLNNIYGKVLALYPRNEDFWLQAALHELNNNNNIHAASKKLFINSLIDLLTHARSYSLQEFYYSVHCELINQVKNYG